MLGRFLPALLTLVLLLTFQSVYAAPQIISGASQVGNNINYGTTSYSLQYSYPSVADVGTNLTIAVTLHVSSLTGLAEYIDDYQLLVTIFGAPQPIFGNVSSPNGSNFLYPGANWGPQNITIPLTPENTGLATGASFNATLSMTLSDYVFIGLPFYYFTPEPQMRGDAGSLIIQNPASTSASSSTTVGNTSNTQALLPYALLASGAVLMVFAVFLPRGPRPPLPK
jgi:hypothetical protein